MFIEINEMYMDTDSILLAYRTKETRYINFYRATDLYTIHLIIKQYGDFTLRYDDKAEAEAVWNQIARHLDKRKGVIHDQ